MIAQRPTPFGAPPFRLATGPVSDELLVRLSEYNAGWHIERDEHGDLRMSPTHRKSSAANNELTRQLATFAREHGGHAYESSIGFTMPSGAVLSPDASWITESQFELIRNVDGFPTLVPHVVVEVRSVSDSWSAVVAKIEAYAAWGSAYAVAIDPIARVTHTVGVAPKDLRFDLEAIFDAE